MCTRRSERLARKENHTSKDAFDGINTGRNITPNGYCGHLELGPWLQPFSSATAVAGRVKTKQQTFATAFIDRKMEAQKTSSSSGR